MNDREHAIGIRIENDRLLEAARRAIAVAAAWRLQLSIFRMHHGIHR